MKYALFLGCTIPARGLHYEASARKVAEFLGIELVDMPGAGCCGMPIRNVNQTSSLAMSAAALQQAEEMGLELVTLCSACNSTLTEAAHLLHEDKELREKTNATLKKAGKKPYGGTTKVWHFTRLLHEKIGPEKIADLIKTPLSGVKIVSHAGCHYLKPRTVFGGFDSPEDPVTLDALIEATGAESVQIINRNECCGGGILGFKEDTSVKIAGGKLKRIIDAGDIDAMVLHCPFCNIMYESHQKKLERDSGEKIDLPIIFLPELLGLAFGLDTKELGFGQHKVKPSAILEKLGV
ncbi:MAG TPA: CoB--CoM heterodisulfide reductase iron-sulfur subunit B family protein [Caldisericia bacterium]|nr:CoB--CoM heterodisulfide reductase iron-sulfur subunit B family protein [Caldisericia bacterium]HPF49354.1 CoB--CoM heterodisulfide reductase iron-sulfur subunit B family protein [Caldisericia bacterium]HPI84430.1 CoB--CoM heterodisulfide reductase iron-sulfur subunit B family protein [Caldisericia bacterium]HPQ93809.1 CoB--CoM heterodisulfide reductase iron-sulfur subunit B family protein [Caldisericia bacterium]HRV75627.1 CoB--CoM heterodisulfide reductase iron-sulfur subunit B family prot